jgi:hypothetical protein
LVKPFSKFSPKTFVAQDGTGEGLLAFTFGTAKSNGDATRQTIKINANTFLFIESHLKEK